MFLDVVFALVMPAPIETRAQLHQHGQVLDTSTVGAPFPVNLNIVTFLLMLGLIRRCMGLHPWLHHQRRQGARLHRFGGFDRCQCFDVQINFLGSGDRGQARYDFHDCDPSQTVSSLPTVLKHAIINSPPAWKNVRAGNPAHPARQSRPRHLPQPGGTGAGCATSPNRSASFVRCPCRTKG